MAHLNQLQDTIRFNPEQSLSASAKQTLIFFLPGNPGFVEYYRNFLQQIHGNLHPAGVTVFGASYIGFEMHAPANGMAHNPPYSLQEVIDGVTYKLLAEVSRVKHESRITEPVRVVLMGHSVGSYMLLEVMTWWRDHINKNPQDQHLLQIIGGVCLFPTIVDIAKSPRGKVMSVSTLCNSISLHIH